MSLRIRLDLPLLRLESIERQGGALFAAAAAEGSERTHQKPLT
jgi:hypothetical protein